MPSGLLHDINVRYYLPVDDLVEYTKNLSWTDVNLQFAPSILTSGIKADSSNFRLFHTLSPYDSLVSASGFTCCIWSSGFFADDSKDRIIEWNYTNNSNVVKNGIWLNKTVSTDVFNVRLFAGGANSEHSWIPAPPNNTGWHLVVIDARFETSGWRARVSLDGSGWVDLGVDTNTNVPTDDTRISLFFQTQTPGIGAVFDEIVVWGDNDLFTNQELSNLYELFNTHGTTMDHYTSTFGTLVTDNIDCFIQGHEQTSGNIFLYIPGQKETKSIDLYIKVIASASGNVDNFIQGSQISSGNVNQYVYGYESTSGNFDLYVSGIPSLSSSIDLYIKGPLQTSGSFDDIITGHLTSSGNFSLFIRSGLDIDAFVAVVDNNPSNTVDLFIHGIPSGASPSLFVNNSISLFITNDGSSVEVQQTWPGFVSVASGIPVASSGIWDSFLRGGNTSDNNIDLYVNSHAFGEAPHGILTSGSFTAFIEGKSLLDGDEGLLSNGYFAKSFQASSFAKVHLGVSDTSNLYVSGATTIIPPSATLDLFVFGISGIVSGSHTLYILGNELITGSHDLSVFGIQGIESGNIPLFIQVTTLGSLNTKFNLYTHGF